MTEIKTAQAWGDLHHDTGFLRARTDNDQGIIIGRIPVVIVHGLTESEIHEAAALLEKSREVCEWRYDKVGYINCDGRAGIIVRQDVNNYCPSCGRKVVVK